MTGEVNSFTWDGYSRLTEAVQMNNYALVQRLIVVEGADVNLPDRHTFSRTPLITSISNKDPIMAKQLIKLGAVVNLKCDGIYPIHAACRMCSIEMVDLLIQNGAILNVYDDCGYLPITIAIKGINDIEGEWPLKEKKRERKNSGRYYILSSRLEGT